MHSFVDLDRVLGAVPAPLVMTLRDIDRGQGSEGLYLNQVPDLLTELANRARVASITASSALEGVVVKNRSRAAAIIANKPIELRTRSEQELAGYRAALDYLFAEDWRPLNVGLLLHLHRLLFAETKATGGTFKESDNLVVDRSPDGVQTVRFKPSLPLAPSTTPLTSSTATPMPSRQTNTTRCSLSACSSSICSSSTRSTTAMVVWRAR